MFTDTEVLLILAKQKEISCGLSCAYADFRRGRSLPESLSHRPPARDVRIEGKNRGGSDKHVALIRAGVLEILAHRGFPLRPAVRSLSMISYFDFGEGELSVRLRRRLQDLEKPGKPCLVQGLRSILALSS